MEQERVIFDHRMSESKDQMAKMSETMKTLNGIFKQMRDDSTTARAMELKEANEKVGITGYIYIYTLVILAIA